MQNSQTNTFLKGMNLDTAKEFIGSDQYIDALDVHINTDAGATAGALQPYLDVLIDKDDTTLAGQKILGATTGHFGKSKENCYIVLSYDETGDENWVSVFSVATNKLLWKLITSDLKCNTRTKLVNLWENEKISRVYISSEDSYILIVNINQKYGDTNGIVSHISGYDFSMFPKCGALPPVTFNGIVPGNKVAGKVQYAYLFFDESGKTTALSAISKMIPIGSELENNITNQGVVVQCISKPALKYVRIYEIRYTNFEDLPRIYIKDEFETNGELFTYSDISDNALSEITLEEFQAIKSVQFKASTIDIKDNRLFAANITEQQFDINFDARVYAANVNGQINYTDNTGNSVELSIDVDSDLIEVPKTHVFNNQDPSVYKYGRKIKDGKRILGGSGPKISYEFVCPVLIPESHSGFDRTKGTALEKVLPSTSVGADLKNEYREITMLSDFSRVEYNKDYARCTPMSSQTVSFNSLHRVKKLDYSDPYICSNYVGFKLGEYYNFGIVFYNLSNIPSPVHYIGVIHIPYLKNTYGTFTDNAQMTHDLAVTPVGIRFTIDTTGLSQEGVVAYEIVRSLKTTDSRKILCLGIASSMYPYAGHTWAVGDADLRFPIFPTFGSSLRTVDNYNQHVYTLQYEHKLVTKYVSVTSPEISINKENFETSIGLFSHIKPIKSLFSFMLSDEDLWKKVKTNIKGGYDFGGNGAYPIANYFTYATAPSDSYTVNKKTYDHWRVFGTSSLSKDDRDTIDFEGMPLKNKHDSMAYALFKYYVESDLFDFENSEIHSAILCTTLPADQIGESSSEYAKLVDEMSVVNMSVALGRKDGNKLDLETVGGHGNCLVFTLKNDSAWQIDAEYATFANISFGSKLTDGKISNDFEINYRDFMRIPTDSSTSYITRPDYVYNYYKFLNVYLSSPADGSMPVNIPGVVVIDLCTSNTSNILYSYIPTITYTSFGNYVVLKDENSTLLDVFGGDTYVCLHKELWSGYGYDENYKNGTVKARASVNIKYPVETRINLDRVSGPNYDTVEHNIGLQFEPGQSILGYSQELPLNGYNDAYSAQEYNKVFVVKGVWDITSLRLGNRIMASEVKSTGELTDSFQNFKVANYIDVDGQYGPITNLVKYNGRLYYLQSTAFGTVSVNERSLITDNNNAQLLLGTGDVLLRYDYISTFNGSKELNDPSVVASPSSLYWYDSNKKSILVFNQGGLNSLSKVKNVLSYFDKQVGDKLVHSGYDMKYNEVWFSPENSGKSIIYSEQVQAFVGFYSKILKYPKVGSRFSLGLTDNNKFIHFGECDGHINTEPSLRYVEFVVNQNAGMPKVFDTFSVNDCIRPMLDEVPWFGVKFSTNRQGEASQTRPANKEGVYYMPIGRDSNKERMRDKMMTVKLTLNTTEFSIPSVSTMFRYSRI